LPQPLALAAGQSLTLAGIDFLALDPFEQRLWHQPILGTVDFTAARS
jgi:hypothetical protein